MTLPSAPPSSSGSAVLFLVIIAAAALQLRRAARNPGGAHEEPDTGVLDTVDSGGKRTAVVSEDFHKVLYS